MGRCLTTREEGLLESQPVVGREQWNVHGGDETLKKVRGAMVEKDGGRWRENTGSDIGRKTGRASLKMWHTSKGG